MVHLAFISFLDIYAAMLSFRIAPDTVKKALNIKIFVLLVFCLQGCGFMWGRAMMPDYRCSAPFAGIRAAPEMCKAMPLACPIEVPLSLAADLIVLPYDVVKPMLHEECRWDRNAPDTIGMSDSELEQAVADAARVKDLDGDAAILFENRTKYLAEVLGMGHYNKRVEAFLRALHQNNVRPQDLKHELILLSEDARYADRSFEEMGRYVEGGPEEGLLKQANTVFVREGYALEAPLLRLVDRLKVLQASAKAADDPQEWEAKTYSLGLALSVLGGQQRDADKVRLAIAEFKAVQENFSNIGRMRDWGYLEKKVGNLNWQLGAWENDLAFLQRSIDSYHAALDVFRPEDRPEEWLLNEWTLSTLSRPHVSPFSEQSWPLIEYDLALAYLTIGDRLDDNSARRHSIRALDAAISDYRQRDRRNSDEIRAADKILKRLNYEDQEREESMASE